MLDTEGLELAARLAKRKDMHEVYAMAGQIRKASIQIGSRVRFEARGDVWEGTVVKRNPKRLSVACDKRNGEDVGYSPEWKVPASRLEVIS